MYQVAEATLRLVHARIRRRRAARRGADTRPYPAAGRESACATPYRSTALPQNRVYLYGFRQGQLLHTCGTSSTPAGGIENLAGQPYPTYRQAMRAFHSHYPLVLAGNRPGPGLPHRHSHQQRRPAIPCRSCSTTSSPGQSSPTDAPPWLPAQVLNNGVPDATFSPGTLVCHIFAGWLLLPAPSHIRGLLLAFAPTAQLLEAIFFRPRRRGRVRDCLPGVRIRPSSRLAEPAADLDQSPGTVFVRLHSNRRTRPPWPSPT